MQISSSIDINNNKNPEKKKKGIPNCTYSQSIMKTKQFKKETYIFIIF